MVYFLIYEFPDLKQRHAKLVWHDSVLEIKLAIYYNSVGLHYKSGQESAHYYVALCK